MAKHTDPNNFIKIWFYRITKLSVFGFIVLAFYAVYLDAWVNQKMTGPKWETPVKVFARPLQLHKHKFLPKSELISELKLLGYKSVKRVIQPGQFSNNSTFVEVYRRGFTHIDGEVAPKRLRIGFEGSHVMALEANTEDGWQSLNIEQLDPMLISRQATKSNEDREIVDLSLVPEWMVDTLLVVEDRNFYHHHGVSPLAIIRALVANVMAGRNVQGGSTLTQQLAKNLLLNDSRKTYFRKFKEAMVALILDYRFSKDDILQAYFNEVYLGQNGNRAVHGFALASKFYFGKPLAQLQQHEFALLTAMVKGPSYYSPTRQKARTKERRDLVLQLMVSHNVMDRDEYQHFVDLPMTVNLKKTKGRSPFPSYMQLVSRELKQLDFGEESQKGMLVFTGLDPLLQHNYQKSFAKSVQSLEKKHKLKGLNGAVVSIDLDNGAVMALIGDRNSQSLGFNRALDTNRNIGSLIKPAVYLTALSEPEYHLATPLPNTPIKMKNNKGKQWQPENYDKTVSDHVLLFDALTKSMNLPTVHLGMDLGLNQIINTLRVLGATQSIDKYPSLLLGAVPMSPLKVAEIYQPIASFGQKLSTSAIVHVTDSEGLLLWEKDQTSREVSDYQTSFELAHALEQVTRTGTAKRLGMYYPKVQYAGKTGTTDDLRDSWFAGFDQNKVTSVWVGKDDNSPVELTGSQGALSVFMALQTARQAESIKKPQPNDVETRYVDVKTGDVLSDDCGEFIELPITAGKVQKVKECPSIFDWF